MPVSTATKFCVIRWDTEMKHKGWDRYEMREMPIQLDDRFEVVREDLWPKDAFSLVQELENKPSKAMMKGGE